MTLAPAPPMPPPIVAVDWLLARMDQVVLADVRWYLDGRSGREAYTNGHLPGAVWVDLDGVLSAPPSGPAGRHPLPTAEDLAAGLGTLGIGDDDLVVAYDDQGGGSAARLVWLLRRLGQAAALLDGGLAAWPRDLERGVVTRQPCVRALRWLPADAVRDTPQVSALTGRGDAVLVDARDTGRYAGHRSLPSDARAGHIPGAVNAPWADNLGPDGRFRSADDLRAIYQAVGVTSGTEVVVYCGSGVTACHDLLAMEHSGLPVAALYPGSWSAWAAQPDLPVESMGTLRRFADDAPPARETDTATDGCGYIRW